MRNEKYKRGLMTETRRLRILITNDDGIKAKGISLLISLLREADFADLYVVAPLEEQSGRSMAFSLVEPTALEPFDYPQRVQEAWAVTGTPVDCVKLAIGELFKENALDLILSGINNGKNSGRCLYYSATVGAIREANLHGIPAIALSQSENIAFFQEAHMASLIRSLCEFTVAYKHTDPLGLNVNFPASTDDSPWKGIRFTLSGNEFLFGIPRLVRTEGNRRYYTLYDMRDKVSEEFSEEYLALANNYISAAPLVSKNTPRATLSEEELAFLKDSFEQSVLWKASLNLEEDLA